MGVNLTPIIVKRVVSLEALRGKTLAVDANNCLHQFLALIRMPDGRPLTDPEGRVTSHLVGLAFRTTRLLADYQIRTVFVFDGKPPMLKGLEVERRREQRRRAEEEWRAALRAGDYAAAFSKAVMTGRLTREMVEDAKHLLDLLGIPWVQAPSEGEAQAAYMARRGDVWASNSRDYDSLLFGAPRLVRYVTISGTEFLPSKGVARRLEPEVIELDSLLRHHGITRRQLVDLAILIGTDFNEGVRGVGPKTALSLVKRYGCLEEMPGEVREKLPQDLDAIRRIFLEPEVTEEYEVRWGTFREAELYEFLCGERGFSRDRVRVVVERMRRFYAQRSLRHWLREGG
ncbi:flap endonuclease-1 [Candidatus Bathyarchaeota archaeon]|nr:MAG: flap endonuclease-1 [Candidatus Bathyarchaeota archaeon]